MYDKKITVLYKLKKEDNQQKIDAWYKTFLNNAEYSVKKIASVSGTTVSMGQTFVVLIPFDNLYRPYDEWKNDTIGYTLNTGDLIVLGEHIPDTPTASNITAIKNSYKGRICDVRVIMEATRKVGMVRLKVEGV